MHTHIYIYMHSQQCECECTGACVHVQGLSYRIAISRFKIVYACHRVVVTKWIKYLMSLWSWVSLSNRPFQSISCGFIPLTNWHNLHTWNWIYIFNIRAKFNLTQAIVYETNTHTKYELSWPNRFLLTTQMAIVLFFV